MGNPIIHETMRDGKVYKGFIHLVEADQVDSFKMLAIAWVNGRPHLFSIVSQNLIPSDATSALTLYFMDAGISRDRIRIQTFTTFPTYQSSIKVH